VTYTFLRRLKTDQYLPLLVTLLAGLWLAWSVVSGLVSLLGSPEPVATDVGSITSSSGSAAAAPRIDPEQFGNWKLFGNTDQAPVIEVAPALSAEEESAEETRLPLRLQGVVVAKDERLSRAVISHKNAQDSYRIGDALPVGQQVKLARVLADRVLLDNRGQLEKLPLYEDELEPGGSQPQGRSTAPASEPVATRTATPASAPAADQPPGPAITHPASLLGSNNFSRLNTLRKTVRLAPARNANNQVVGYRLSAGPDQEMFRRLGLEEGDLVTHLNGLAVGSIEPEEVMDLVNGRDVAEITVQRGDTVQVMRLDFNG